VRGASALEAALKRVGWDRPLAVFAVWEPVPPADAAPPSRRALAAFADPRVQELWDPDHLLSNAIREAGILDQARLRTGRRDDGILFDAIGVFAEGALWEQRLPSPSYLGGGVEAALRELAQRGIFAAAGSKGDRR
jgi:hypothetical protein